MRRVMDMRVSSLKGSIKRVRICHFPRTVWHYTVNIFAPEELPGDVRLYPSKSKSSGHTDNAIAMQSFRDWFHCDWLAIAESVATTLCSYLELGYGRRSVRDTFCNLSVIDRQLIGHWNRRYGDMLAIFETDRRLVGECSVTGCNWTVTAWWLVVDRSPIKTKCI